MVRSLDPMQRLIRELQELQSRVKALETTPRLQNSSIDRGSLKVLSDEGLIIGAEGSGSGSARVYGLLLVDGQLRIIGAAELTGTLEVNDDGSISLGGVTLTGDNIDVDGSGTVTVGGITITPSVNGGSVEFGDGRAIHAGSGYLGMYNDADRFIVFNSSGVTVYAEGRSLQITSSGIRFSGLPTTPLSSAPSGAFVGAVISDGSGYLSRVVV